MLLDELLEFEYQCDKRTISKHIGVRAAIVIATLALIFIVLPLLPHTAQSYTADAASPSAKGKTVEAVNVRAGASSSSAYLGTLKKGAKVTITTEVFTSKSSRSASKRWYYVSGSGKKGYVRADYIKITSYSTVPGFTTDALNYRKGAGTSMERVGTVGSGGNVKVYLTAKASDGSTWYKVKANGSKGYMIADYLRVGVTSISGYASNMRANPTNGGKARYMGTLDITNCKKLFSVTGSGGAYVPQGLAFTGSKYYVVFGMDHTPQRIATYSKSGKKLSTSKFGYDIGHMNGMTWNPQTKLCYIFKGMQTTIYTWNPATNKYGKAKTPYSSSGVAYDSSTKQIYTSSLSGMRIYTSDGTFTHQKFFNKCSHVGKTYVQDCGAGSGIMVHAQSSGNKFGVNYLDFYRVLDGKYLGSFKVNLGELESVVVDKKGNVQLLVNHGGTITDWVWKTPINVNKLK